jgi:hypothetical protein
MNQTEANQLLDKLREGQQFPFEQISAALFATGDLHDPMRGQRVEGAVQDESQGDWQAERPELVVGCESRHSADSWQGWSRYLDCRNEQATT